MIKYFSVIVVIFTSSLSSACTIPPETLMQSYEALISRSPNIVLAKVIQQDATQTAKFFKFTFETLEHIQGSAPPVFELTGYSAMEKGQVVGNFSGHREPVFWAFATGNSSMPGDCNAYGHFSVGKTYLIFYGGPSHTKSFEEIASQDDIWLNVVKLLANTEES